MNSAFEALLLSLVAGLGTAVGGILVVKFVSLRAERVIGQLQALSAGVMLYISIFDILPEASEQLSRTWLSIFFFSGIMFMAVLDAIFPEELINRLVDNYGLISPKSPTMQSSEELQDLEQNSLASTTMNTRKRSILKSGWITFVGMAMHNAPEGVAVYLGTLKNQRFGMSLAFAIACHNIPEGMAVAIPLFFASKKESFAVKMTLINGLFEPLAVLLCIFIFGTGESNNVNNGTFNYITSAMLSGVAGIMTFISLHELYPTSIQYCSSSSTSTSATSGRDLAMRTLVGGMLIGFAVMSTAQLIGA